RKEWMVCRPTLRNREHLQNLRGKFHERVTSTCNRERSTGDREQRTPIRSQSMNDGEPVGLPPFPPEYRASGVLLHVTSLPSPYGIGDLGSSAFAWVNRLHDSGQKWWQALPLGPTGYGNSPYQPMSSFAGNAMLISPGSLVSDGLLTAKDCDAGFPSDFVDYDAVVPFKVRLLETAWNNFKTGRGKHLSAEFEEFRTKQEHWLEDYALFRALKAKYNGAYYLDWPQELVQRTPEALASARR